jgi:hypothetical protein
MTDPAMKRCTKCGEYKPLSDFHVRRKSADGLNLKCKQCVMQYVRRYVEINYSVILVRRRERYRDQRGTALSRMRDYRESHRETLAARERERRKTLRAQVFAHYGTVCACCGSADDLTIDHVNGDGAEHRKELFGTPRGASGTQFYLWLIRHDFPSEPPLQVLCRACNRSKRDSRSCRIDHSP